MDPSQIHRSFKPLKNCGELEIQGFFVNFIKHAESLYPLLEAIIKYPLLENAAKKDYMNPVWDSALEFYKLRKQETISSFHLIMGAHIHSKIESKPPGKMTEEMSVLLKRAINEYSSYHCLDFQLTDLLEQFKKQQSTDFMNEILSLATEGFKHSTPGYVLYAYVCWLFSEFDSTLLSFAFKYLKLAKEREGSAANEIYNAYYGEGMDILGAKNVADLLSLFSSKYPEVKENEYVNPGPGFSWS